MADQIAKAKVASEEKKLLPNYLRAVQESLLWKLEGLSDEELRRPMTKSTTNLVGIVKHLAQVTSQYLCGLFGQPYEEIPWDVNEDTYATPDESCDEIIAFYRRACDAGMKAIDSLDLDTTFRHQSGVMVSFRYMLLIVLLDTYRHTGHADVVREMIDGRVGSKPGDPMSTQDYDEELLSMRRKRISGEIDRDAWVAYRDSRVAALKKAAAKKKQAAKKATAKKATATKATATKAAAKKAAANKAAATTKTAGKKTAAKKKSR